MGDNIWLGTATAVRTPMQWSPDRNAGFSNGDPGRLYLPAIMDPIYGYQAVNVEAQQKNPGSLLHFTRKMIEIRKRHPVFGTGRATPSCAPPTRACSPSSGSWATTGCCASTTCPRFPQPVELDLRTIRGHRPRWSARGGVPFPPIGELPVPFDASWAWVLLVHPSAHERSSRGDVTPTLEELLAGWITHQRWFAGKGRAITELAVESATPLPVRGPAESFHRDVAVFSRTTERPQAPRARDQVALRHLVITVRQDTQTDRYQLLLGFRPELPQRLRHVSIGETAEGFAYDAVHDADVTGILLSSIAEGADLGALRFRHMPGAQIDTSPRSLVLGAEQSNTSLVYGDQYICKLFRKLVPGVNPELEVVSALAERGSPNIAGPYGWIEADIGGENTTLAFTQEFLPTASDGWALALTSVRDLYGSLPGTTAGDAGGDFAAESHRLGVATAHLHKELAAAFPTGTVEPPEVKRMAEGFRRRLEQAIAEVPELAGHAEVAHEAFDRLAGIDRPIHVQRVHGDYHLGQVMRTPGEWVVLDFEGEPGQPLSERRALDSPARDMAGMLRSFDYAARHLLSDHPDADALAARAAEWSQRNRAAFVAGYSAGGGHIRGDDAVLLRALELSKAAYEVIYEARNRPTWLPIPLAAFVHGPM